VHLDRAPRGGLPTRRAIVRRATHAGAHVRLPATARCARACCVGRAAERQRARVCGFLLVKSPAELDAVVAEGPGKVLKGVACESMHETQVAGGPELDGDVGIP
jgi:hypothetical protein